MASCTLFHMSVDINPQDGTTSALLRKYNVMPVIYCESNEGFVELLQNRMHRMEIPSAPIWWQHVTKLKATDLPSTVDTVVMTINEEGKGYGMDALMNLIRDMTQIRHGFKPNTVIDVTTLSRLSRLKIFHQIQTMAYVYIKAVIFMNRMYLLAKS